MHKQSPSLLIRLGFDLEFSLPAPAEAFFALSIHPSRRSSIRKPEGIRIVPDVPLVNFIDPFGNDCGRASLPAGIVRFTNDTVVEDDGHPDSMNPNARQLKVGDLPPEALHFLLPSRYCEVDSELLQTA